jgi:hypothetical protein
VGIDEGRRGTRQEPEGYLGELEENLRRTRVEPQENQWYCGTVWELQENRRSAEWNRRSVR